VPDALLFISATGTNVGKTWVTRGLARGLLQKKLRVAAIKPIETGVSTSPADALALGHACKRPELAHAPGLYRAIPPVTPYAAELEGSAPVDVDALVQTIQELSVGSDIALVEGAGGLLAPITKRHTNADLAHALHAPLLLVARDALGTLSHTLTAVESAKHRGIALIGVVLVQGPWSAGDASCATNLRILQERIHVPVVPFAESDDDDDELAENAAPLLAMLLESPLLTANLRRTLP
jgi:dethiobiotin synthetase